MVSEKIIKLHPNDADIPTNENQNPSAKEIAIAFIKLDDNEVLDFYFYGHSLIGQKFMAYTRVKISRLRRAAIERGLRIRSFRVNTKLFNYISNENVCHIQLTKKAFPKQIEKDIADIFDADSKALV